MSDLIAFDATLTDAQPSTADVLMRRGKIFQIGQYEDKAFSLTEAEADAAIAAFAPVPADYEHVPGPLDGKLGTLQAVWRQGADLFGEVAIPAWLDPLLADTGRKLSLVWDRTSKQIVGWGWVRSPRISDAALYAAFAGARHSSADQRAIQTAHDHLVQAGAECAGPPKEARMSFVETVKAWLNAGAPAEFSMDEAGGGVATGGTTPPDPLVAELKAQFAAEQARVATMEAERRQEKAAVFADSLVTKGHILPALRGYALALYAQALADDAAHGGQVTFSDSTGVTQEGSRAALVAACFAALPPHTLTREVLASAAVLPGERTAEADPAEAEARRKKLLKATPLGQSALHQNGKD